MFLLVFLGVVLWAPAADTSQFVEVRGAKLYVETFGGGVPILFLHGGAVFFDNNFAAQRDYFASFRKVLTRRFPLQRCG